MEISDIKQRLSIKEVLAHYGLEADKNQRLCCPFHNDHTPSMQVYAETGTVYCFSSKCTQGGKAIDQIDFIMYKENINKHEAIKRAGAMLNGATDTSTQVKKHKTPTHPSPTTSIPSAVPSEERMAIVAKIYAYFRKGIYNSPPAREYMEKRGLDYIKIDAGYNSAQFHHRGRISVEDMQTCEQVGLLIPSKNGSRTEHSYTPWAAYCIVFPLKDAEGRIVSLYGRSTINDDKQKHYYLKDRTGLYPGYPAANTKTLILTEAIIDAATLLQHKDVTLSEVEVLSCFGTNGLTNEHQQAIKDWIGVGRSEIPTGSVGKEIIFAFDNDEAGRKATEKYAQELISTSPHLHISTLELPEGEDINSVSLSHEPGIFAHLMETRRKLLFSSETSTENKNVPASPLSNLQTTSPHQQISTSANQPVTSSCVLNTTNPERISYTTPDIKIEVWGGIDYANLHRLRLSLYVENTATGQSFRDDVNLYSHRSSKAFVQDASEELGLAQSELKQVLDNFTREAEEYRMQQKEQHKTEHKQVSVAISQQEQREALQLLKSKTLIDRLKAAMQRVGLIGETGNGLLLFLIFLTRYFDTPLHALVHGSTGSGKTNLLKSILKLVPPESKYETTALTENVLFRPPHKDFWKNKILLLEDLDGSYAALLPLREFMTNQYISKFASEPNPRTGKYEQALLEAFGPIVIAGATTKDKLYEDNSNRSFLLHINESNQHQQQILDYQNRAAAGLIDKSGTDEICSKIHNIQRMLNPNIKVINPFQPQLKLPEYVFRKLRTNTHYITLIQSITWLFQHQRELKKRDTPNGSELYIETTLDDVELANALSRDSLLRKSDELSGAVRDFFENLKAAVKQSSKDIFFARDIRSHLRMHPMKFSRYISELRSRGYVKKVSGKENGSFEYQITIWDDYQILRQGLEIMDRIAAKLRKQYPDGIYKPATTNPKEGNNSYYPGNNIPPDENEISLNQTLN